MIDDLNLEIQRICNELLEDAQIIAQLPPVSHLSKSKIQFTGGILGALQENREMSRLKQLINAPICKDWSFYTYAFHLIDTAEELASKQLKVQELSTEEDNCYYENVRLIVHSIDEAHRAWYCYSPDMAVAGIRVGDKDDVSLELSVDTYTKEEVKKLHLPPELSFINEEKRNKGGCLGLILILLIPSLALMFA